MPMMRGMAKRGIPKALRLVAVSGILIGSIALIVFLFQLSAKEVVSSGDDFYANAEAKVNMVIDGVNETLGIEKSDENSGSTLPSSNILSGAGSTIGAVGSFLTQFLMTLFFMLLWLSESISIMDLLRRTKDPKKATAAFIKIKDDLITFIKVKFWVSFGTGVLTGLSCLAFGVSFPILWGIFAFAINFVQMIGSFITVILLSIFALVEMEPSGTLLFFVISITMAQVIFGGILEPIFMGKSFSINVITVLVMLSLWGFIWGVAGLIMSIPITVFIKIMLEQNPSTAPIAKLLAGTGGKISLRRKRVPKMGA